MKRRIGSFKDLVAKWEYNISLSEASISKVLSFLILSSGSLTLALFGCGSILFVPFSLFLFSNNFSHRKQVQRSVHFIQRLVVHLKGKKNTYISFPFFPARNKPCHSTCTHFLFSQWGKNAYRKWFYLKRTNLSENYEQVFILETWLIWYEKPNGNIPEPVVTFPTPPSVTLILRCPEFFPRQRSSFVAHGMIFFLHSLCHGSGSNGHGYTTHRICRPSNTTSCLPSLVASTEKDHRSNEP